MVQPGGAGLDATAQTAGAGALPLYRDVLWDSEQGRAVWTSSGPVMVEGARALEGWIWRALSTVRRRYPIFTHDYGCEAESLIGRPYTPEVRESEGIRMIREALEPSPYILGVRQAKISFEGSQLTLEAQIDTAYGEVHTNVRG